MKRLITRSAGAVLITAALGLSAAGVAVASVAAPSRDATTSSAVAVHNTVDVTFARLIYLHHLGAIQMTEDAATRATGKTKALAALIEKQQKADLPVIRGLLRSYGLSTTVASMRDTPDQSLADRQAMADGMTASEMHALKRVPRGLAFDRAFLSQMSVHHGGAVELAAIDLAHGENSATMTFANKVAASQAAQILVMRHLLASLSQ